MMTILRGLMLLLILLSCGGKRNIDEDHRDKILNYNREEQVEEVSPPGERNYDTSIYINKPSLFYSYKIATFVFYLPIETGYGEAFYMTKKFRLDDGIDHVINEMNFKLELKSICRLEGEIGCISYDVTGKITLKNSVFPNTNNKVKTFLHRLRRIGSFIYNVDVEKKMLVSGHDGEV